MSENRKQILDMLAAGKINSEEAERLLSALEKGGVDETRPSKAKYLRIMVESDESHNTYSQGEHHNTSKEGSTEKAHGPTKVNIKVPMQLLRAGVKLVSLIPAQARGQVDEALKKQGVEFDLSQLKPENLEELIDHLNELTVDVDDDHNKVRIFCE